VARTVTTLSLWCTPGTCPGNIHHPRLQRTTLAVVHRRAEGGGAQVSPSR
jgi:hypothetical protein